LLVEPVKCIHYQPGKHVGLVLSRSENGI